MLEPERRGTRGVLESVEVLFTVKALYAFKAEEENELSVAEAEVLEVVCKDNEDQGWYEVVNNENKRGLVPVGYVEKLEYKPADDPAAATKRRTRQRSASRSYDSIPPKFLSPVSTAALVDVSAAEAAERAARQASADFHSAMQRALAAQEEASMQMIRDLQQRLAEATLHQNGVVSARPLETLAQLESSLGEHKGALRALKERQVANYPKSRTDEEYAVIRRRVLDVEESVRALVAAREQETLKLQEQLNSTVLLINELKKPLELG